MAFFETKMVCKKSTEYLTQFFYWRHTADELVSGSDKEH